MKESQVFVFAYYSYRDPVFQSAVLPYFIDFPSKKIRFTILTWEQKRFTLTAREKQEVENYLNENNIKWYRTYWHSGYFKIAKKIFDTFWGVLYSLWIIKKQKIDVIYSEGFPGAIIGHIIAQITGKKHIVHTFEPHADAMIEAGVWSRNSWEALILKYFEKKIAKKASGIITATNGMIEKIKTWGTEAIFLRAPSCVDTSHFVFNDEERVKLRKLHNVSTSDFVITYLGKFGGMYMEEEMFEFFSYCETHCTVNLHYWIFTIDPIDDVWGKIKKYNIPENRVVVKAITRDEVPKYLSASDVGFVGVRPKPSRRFCSPIKDGEYWSCGLPILIPSGISDDYLLAHEHEIGIVLEGANPKAYDKVLDWIAHMNNNKNDVRKAARAFAIHDRSLAVYKSKFNDLFERILKSDV